MQFWCVIIIPIVVCTLVFRWRNNSSSLVGCPPNMGLKSLGGGGAMDGAMKESRGEFQDYPGMEEEQPPLISGNLSDIAR